MAILLSLNLWLMFGARSRKQVEFEPLVQQAELTRQRWIAIDSTLFLLEASPA